MYKYIRSLLIAGFAFVLMVSFVVPVSAMEIVGVEKTLENGYYPEDSQIYLEATPAMQSMYDLQNDITDVLRIKNGEYSFNTSKIKQLIFSFDFTELNKEIDEQLTNEQFYEMVISQLENTSPKLVEEPGISTFAYTEGPMCYVTKTDTIWNSRREYRPHTNTASHIYKLRSDATALNAAWTITVALNQALLNTLYIAYPGLKWAVKAATVAKSVPVNWMKGVANSLEKSNYNTCGTVLDINIAGWYSSWNQQEN